MKLTAPDIHQLRGDLLAYRGEHEAPDVRAGLIDSTLPRLLATLEIMPEGLRDAAVLELGAVPFFLTLCLRRLCRGPLTLASYFGNGDRRLEASLRHAGSGAEQRFDVDLFNVEGEDFPYPDASFDAVIFAELIEHLAVNPLRALAEMHRVLRPNGILIVTTPNRLSMLRLEAFLRGIPQMVDSYAPVAGYGARHNREYTLAELRELLESTGFDVEEVVLRDLAAVSPAKRLHRRAWGALLRLYSDHPHEEHIFIRARRREGFRWHFPPSLFENTELFTYAREAWLRMGRNDAIQATIGWEGLGEVDGRPARRLEGNAARCVLRMPNGRPALHLECRAASGAAQPLSLRVVAQDRWLGPGDPEFVFADQRVSIESGAWRHVTIALRAHPPAGNEVEVVLTLETHPAALAVATIELA